MYVYIIIYTYIHIYIHIHIFIHIIQFSSVHSHLFFQVTRFGFFFFVKTCDRSEFVILLVRNWHHSCTSMRKWLFNEGVKTVYKQNIEIIWRLFLCKRGRYPQTKWWSVAHPSVYVNAKDSMSTLKNRSCPLGTSTCMHVFRICVHAHSHGPASIVYGIHYLLTTCTYGTYTWYWCRYFLVVKRLLLPRETRLQLQWLVPNGSGVDYVAESAINGALQVWHMHASLSETAPACATWTR